MKHISKSLLSMLVLSAAVLFTGCVNKKTYENLRSNYDKLQSEYSELQSMYNDAKVNLAQQNATGSSLEQRLSDAQKQNTELKEQLKALQSSLDNGINSGSANSYKLVDEINASNKYIKQLVEAKSKSDSLNLALTNKLTRSLSKSELRDVDVKVLKGVVYISLNDNMLYRSGSYEISPAAGETLAKIAKIITDYDDYEVLVEGNTDDVPISKTNIRNNWDLSCLRASSVVQALQNQYGVNPSRLTAGGRGEYNPLEGNDTAEGRARNRRTQIIITPKLDQFLDLIDQAPEAEAE